MAWTGEIIFEGIHRIPMLASEDVGFENILGDLIQRNFQGYHVIPVNPFQTGCCKKFSELKEEKFIRPNEWLEKKEVDILFNEIHRKNKKIKRSFFASYNANV